MNAAGAALSRVPANTGVHHLMFVPLSLQSGLQQSGPRLVNVNAEARAQAVTEHQNDWRFRAPRGHGKQKQEKGYQFSHVEPFSK